MNRIVKTITACVLALVMLAISPMTDLSQRGSGNSKTAAFSDGTDVSGGVNDG